MLLLKLYTFLLYSVCDYSGIEKFYPYQMFIYVLLIKKWKI